MALSNIFIIHGAPKSGKSHLAWILFRNLIRHGASVVSLEISRDGVLYEKIVDFEKSLQFNPVPHMKIDDNQIQILFFRSELKLKNVSIVISNRGNDRETAKEEAYWLFNHPASIYVCASRKAYIDDVLGIAYQRRGGYHVDDTAILNEMLNITNIDEKNTKLLKTAEKITNRIEFVLADVVENTVSERSSDNAKLDSSINWKKGLMYFGGIIVLGVLIVGVIYSIAKPNYLNDSNLSIILSFMGVIATFIVVGNYAQVSEIRDDIKRRFKEHEDQIQNRIDRSREDSVKQTYSTISQTIETTLKSIESRLIRSETNIKENKEMASGSLNMVDEKYATTISDFVSYFIENGIQALPGYMKIVNKILTTPEATYQIKNGKKLYSKAYIELDKDGKIKVYYLANNDKKMYCSSVSEIDKTCVDFKKIAEIIKLFYPIKQPIATTSLVALPTDISLDEKSDTKTFKR